MLMRCKKNLSIENVVHAEPSDDQRVIKLHHGIDVRKTVHHVHICYR